MADEIRLRVLSYSHATGKRENGTVPWEKLLANDLSVHVNASTARNENLTMTIMHGIKALERIDVAALVNQAVAILATIQKAGGHPVVEQLPVSGMFKEHLFAFKYRLPDGKMRRIQLRFPNVDDCQRLVKILISHGVDFQELRPGTAQPGTAISSTGSSQSQLLGQNGHSPNRGPTTLTNPRPFAPQTLEAGSLSANHHASYPMHSSNSYSNAGQHLTRDEVLAPRDVCPDRPSTAHIYRASTAVFAPSTQLGSFCFDPQVTVSQVENSSSSSHLENLKAFRESAEQFKSPLHSSVFSSQPPLWSSAQNHESVPNTTHLSKVTSTTSMAAVSDEVSNGSPAKQNLSFDRPGPPTSTSYSGCFDSSMQSQMQQDNSVQGYHSLYSVPGPSSKDTYGNRPGTALPLQQSQAATNRPSARPQTAGNFRHITTAEPSFMSLGVDLATEIKDTHRNGNVSTRLESHEATVDDYAAQTPQDRQTALEEWMISNLNNPAFTKLCEDVGNCWRRMALGL